MEADKSANTRFFQYFFISGVAQNGKSRAKEVNAALIRVAHVNFTDSRGGAARVMQALISAQAGHGVEARLFCARPARPDSILLGFGFRARAGLALKLLHQASKLRNEWMGDTHGICGRLYLTKISAVRPDVIHLHNIHDGWFPLRLLPRLAQVAPVVWTLHDEWAITGHCTSTLGCERWTNGCPACPSLHTFVSLRRDIAAANRGTRQRIYRQVPQGRLTMVTPSKWLQGRVERSGLWPGRIEAISNGVDVSAFYPVDRKAARSELNIQREAKVVLFAAEGGLGNPFKNGKLALEALSCLPSGYRMTALVLGGAVPPFPRAPQVSFITPGYVHDIESLRRYYSAADLVVYPTKADTFGLIVAEAMACGTPVLATTVGGVAEQIQNGRNGFLVDANVSAPQLAETLVQILDDRDRLHAMREAAAHSVRERYSSQLMGARYLALYREMLYRNAADHSGQ